MGGFYVIAVQSGGDASAYAHRADVEIFGPFTTNEDMEAFLLEAPTMPANGGYIHYHTIVPGETYSQPEDAWWVGLEEDEDGEDDDDVFVLVPTPEGARVFPTREMLTVEEQTLALLKVVSYLPDEVAKQVRIMASLAQSSDGQSVVTVDVVTMTLFNPNVQVVCAVGGYDLWVDGALIAADMSPETAAAELLGRRN